MCWGDRIQVQELQRRITVGNAQCRDLEKKLHAARDEVNRLRAVLFEIAEIMDKNGYNELWCCRTTRATKLGKLGD